MTLACVFGFAWLLSLAAPSAYAGAGDSRRLFNFNLQPRSFQRTQRLEMTVVTDMTDFGRGLPVASPDHPVRYIAYSRGGTSMGAAIAGGRRPSQEALDAVLRDSLAGRGYLLHTDGSEPPSLLLIFHWGSHYRLDSEMIRLFPYLHHTQSLERALLVGGHRYMGQMLRKVDHGILPDDPAFKMRQLYNQAHTDLYFAVVSAYDYGSVAAGSRRLAWRTYMTVNAAGVSMAKTLPPLILSASGFFGSDMTEPAVMLRDVRRGTVELGPLRYIGEVDESDLPESK